MEYYWWEKMIALPIRRLCRGLAARLGFRKKGLLMLSREVQACEYEDVQIMWEMLQKTESHEVVAHSPAWTKSKPFRNLLSWARCTTTCLNKKF